LLSFNFLDKNSYDDFGIVMKARPSIPLPERRVNYIEVMGRHGSLTEDDETYKDITIIVDCFLVENYEIERKLWEIKGWLSSGVGDLIFSYNPNIKYIGQVVNRIDIVQNYKILGEFSIIFTCQPFTYPTNVISEITEQNTNIDNTVTTFYSTPTITVYGTGNITLTITDYWREEQTVNLINVEDYITIDSTLMECYKDNVLCNHKMSGEFPVLKVRENFFTWTGDVEKIEVLWNLRQL
jgi:predicted phage tail component-like protein